MWEKFQKIFSTLKSNRALGFALIGLVIITTVVNFFILHHEKAVILIEGEKPYRTNCKFLIAKNPLFYQGKSLEFIADAIPENQRYFSLTYKFDVLKTDYYEILIAGTPPGSMKNGGDWDWFCPYWISFDEGEPVHVTKEYLERVFPEKRINAEYIPGGYHWTRLGAFPLKEGEHQIEIRINEKRFWDQQYAFYIDAIFLSPKGWKPIRLFRKIPQDFFTEAG